jgi:hypothetical protein
LERDKKLQDTCVRASKEGNFSTQVFLGEGLDVDAMQAHTTPAR